jgi:hypothetical protein
MSPTKSRPGGTTTETALELTKASANFTDFQLDQGVVDRIDASIWRALFDGHFRLAVKCDLCGRWLTAGASKRAHRGPRCRAKAVK